jgi:hypothetical protein
MMINSDVLRIYSYSKFKGGAHAAQETIRQYKLTKITIKPKNNSLSRWLKGQCHGADWLK